MKRTGKAICAGIAILIVGAIIFVVALGLNDWKWDTFGQFETKTFESASPIDTIKLDFGVGTVKTEFYDGDKILIKYPENNKLSTTVTETNGTLTIATNLFKHWWFNFGLFLNRIPETVISIPQNLKVNLDFKVNAGTVTVAEGTYKSVKLMLNAGTVRLGDAVCDNLDFEVNAGTLKINRVTCDRIICDLSAGTVNLDKVTCDNIDVDVSAGSAAINVIGNIADYNIYTDVSAGSCNVKTQRGADANKQIKVDVSAGSVSVNFS